MVALYALAVGCLLGIFDPPSLGSPTTYKQEAMDLLRVLTTTALAIVFTPIFHPHTEWRETGRDLDVAKRSGARSGASQ
jgi:hypothetical protein